MLKFIKSAFLFILLIGAVQSSQAQSERFEVNGSVVDSTLIGVPSATVVALTRADSVLTKFTTSANDGSFRLRRLVAGEYILQVSYVGYQTIRQNFEIKAADLDIGQLTMMELVSELDELVVSAEHIPFRVSKDTLSYNAAAFATRPNAVVEDLLRRLPGVEVQEDGTIIAQGETVQNVLVDGKEFFGSDPTIATKNLPADAVERVEVYDKQSDQAEFTGIQDGDQQKTINLALKEEARTGYFGSVTGGFGGETSDEGLYDGQLNFNRFNSETQIAVIGNANNINRSSSGFDNARQFVSGSSGGSQGPGIQVGGSLNSGFSETFSAGLNYSRDFGKKDKSWLRSSYFRSQLDNQQDRVVNRESILGSNISSSTDLASDQHTENVAHKGNVNAQITLGEGHDIRLRSNFSFSNSSVSNLSFQETMDASGRTRNSADTWYFNDGDRIDGSGQLTWRKKLNDAGRSLIWFSSANLNDSETTADLESTLGTFDPRIDILTYEEIVQLQSTIGNQFSQRHKFSVIEPIGGVTVELAVERRLQDQDETKRFSDIVLDTPVLNELLSAEFNRTYAYWNGSAQVSKTTEDQFISATVRMQQSELEGTIVDRDVEISNGYTHVLPSLYFRRSLTDASSLQVRYNTSTREPTLTELQPFVDNTNPLSVFIGNPDLEPQYTHSLYTDYRFFDQYTFVNVFASVRSSWTKNQIVQSRTIDEQLKQTFTNVNAGDGWSHNARASFGTPVRRLGIQVNWNNNLTWSTGSQFINDDENESRILRYTPSLTVQNRFRDVFDVRGTYSMTLNDVDYSLNEDQNQQYINSSIRFSGDLYKGGWTFGTAVDFKKYDQEVFGEADNLALLEASIGKLLPNEKTEIQLVVRDVLDQNQGVTYSNSNNYIQEARVETLGRYIMLKLTHKLSKGAAPSGGGKGGFRGRR